MTAPPQQKPKRKSKIVKSKAASGVNAGSNQVGNGRKKKRKSNAKAAASSTTAKAKQKRGRSVAKTNLKKSASKNSALHGSFSSLDSTMSTKSGRSQDSVNRKSRPSGASSQDRASIISGQGRAPGRNSIGKRSRSATGLFDQSGHSCSPTRRLDMAGQASVSSPMIRQSSYPNLSRQNSNQSLGGGGGERTRLRPLQRARSKSREKSPSSFTQRRMNRLGSRMKRSGSASGLSRQSSRSSIYASSDDEGGTSRSRSRSGRSLGRSVGNGNGKPDDLQKIIGMIESSSAPDLLARKKEPSRYERFAQRHRLSSRSLDASVSAHTASTMGDEWPDDETIWVSGLRYIRILAPTPKECRSDRIIRYMTWGAMFLDFIAAIVSITTYDSVTMCCGKPIFELLESRINWNEFVRIFTYIYLMLIFLEVIPVFNKEIPLNLINPLIGFTITLAMFFDDRIGEAITMWAVEALAIAFEAVITWLRRKQHMRRIERIAECDKELAVRDGNKQKQQRRRSSRRPGDGVVDDPYSDLESLSGGSFYNSGDEEINRFRIERERRQLKAGLKEEEIQLRYHFIGSTINISLVLISLIFIVGIGKNGGLCISNFEAPPIFKDDQLERCPACAEATSTCEVCDTTG
eukprot:CAMPEP_0113604518 /NCGR_PEP_ID=MMETSP0017_2-20120614/1836_1 /TAXON_ID=2856 /ORGANISM="Cylindrotheca closterium" /LENGTH=632 /DNA_ID=CAMNT_0000512945 /DNA_START=45 /DNA_END=1939 /DNA_ORIENTATION=+ /assembly_acc=CAM_ASM_000147